METLFTPSVNRMNLRYDLAAGDISSGSAVSQEANVMLARFSKSITLIDKRIARLYLLINNKTISYQPFHQQMIGHVS